MDATVHGITHVKDDAIETWLCCPSCKGRLSMLPEGSQLSCVGCHTGFPVLFGIPDFRQGPLDRTANFEAERDLRIARALWAEYPRRSYFELYEYYCRLMQQGQPPRGRYQTWRMQSAQNAYQRLLKETHLAHGTAILRRASSHLRDIGEDIPIGGVALEDGAGLGQFIYGFSQRFTMVLVVDLSLSYLTLAKKLMAEHGIHNTILVCGNVERLPIQSGSVNFVHFNNMIEHVLHPRAALEEARRVLQERGLLLLVSPNRYSLYLEPHFRIPAFGFFPTWVQKPLAWLIRGVDSIEDIHLYSLAELRDLLQESFKKCHTIAFLPRHLTDTVRQTLIRRLLVRSLRLRTIGSVVHTVLNTCLLGVMPYHVALCMKRADAADQFGDSEQEKIKVGVKGICVGSQGN